MKRSLHSYASTLLATATLLLALTSQNLLAQCNTAGTTFGGGTGTAESPFQISSIAHLNNIRDNSGDVPPGCNYLEKHFVLTKNLDFLDTDGSGADYVYSDNAEGWLPIGHDTDAVSNGYQGTPFTGSFIGASHVILNLRIDRGGEDYVGLFGYVDGGSIVSLGLEDLEVTGNGWVGGLVGRLYIDGTVTGSYATGSVMGGNSVGGLVGSSNRGTVTGSYATGSVMGGNFVGGLVGGVFNRGTVTDSYATGSVVGGGSVGGLVGLSYDTVTGSYATGSVTGQLTVGGLVGSNRGTVTDSYATGSATGRDNVGGLVGTNNGTVTASYATGSVTGRDNVGGLAGGNNGTVTDSYWNTKLSGNATSSGGVGLTTTQMYDQDSFVGFDFAGTPPSGGNPEVLSVWLPPRDDERFPHLRGVSKNGQILSVHRVRVIPGSAPFLLEHTLLPPTIFGQTPAFSSDDDAVATIDASGMITLAAEVTIGDEMTITVRRGGNDDYAPISVSQTLMVIPFVGGTGISVNPWQIGTPARLNAIRGEYLDDHFILTTDLDFSEYTYEDPEKGWLPIGHDTDASSNGHQGTPFTGSFIGASHVIRNLRIDRGGEDYVGLFGYVSDGSIVSLGLEDLEVTGDDNVGGLVGQLYLDGTVTGSYATGSVMGGNSVGGLVGSSNRGTVTGSYATGSVMGRHFVGGLMGGVFNRGTVTDSYATGSVMGGGSVGGLVGLSYNTVTGSYATGSVTGQVTVGGLMGSNRGTVTASYATGSVTGRDNVGGLMGTNNGTVTASYATGSATGRDNVGGLMGTNNGTVTDSYWNTQLSGNATSSGGVGLTTTQMYDQDSFVGFDFAGTPASGDNPEVLSVWLPPRDDERFPHLRGVSKNGQILSVPRVRVMLGSAPFPLEYTLLPPTISEQAPAFSGDDDAVATINASTGIITLAAGVTGGAVMITVQRDGNEDYAPISVSQTLVVIPFGGGTGISVNPWQIRIPAQLNAIRGEYLDDHFLLIMDLDFSGYTYEDPEKGWLPIGHDTDASSNGHQGTRFTGSFDGDGNVIRNLRIDRGGENYVGLFGYVSDGSIVSLGLEDLEVTGDDNVGGLVGRLYLDGTVTGSYATGSVMGGNSVGGLVGSNRGTVTGSYATGSVMGGNFVGGLVGSNRGTVTASYATGSVMGDQRVGGLVGLSYSTVTGSYATGSVTGQVTVGGLVGWNNDTVTGSYATGSVTGRDNVGGLMGTNNGTVTGSYATGSVTGDQRVGGLVGWNNDTVTASYATGSVTGDQRVGGLVGWNNDTVTASYATGSVTGGSNVGGLVGWSNDTVTHSYATGSVTGGSDVGGLVGENYERPGTGVPNVGGLVEFTGGTVTQSYWNTQLSGNADSDGGVGLTTDEMFVQGSFAGFDFDGTTDSEDNAVASVWLPPVSGQHFPHLRGVSKNGQILSVPPRVVVMPGSAPFPLEYTLLPPTISEQPPAFSGDDDAVATIDASTGNITLAGGVTGGAVTITVQRDGNEDYAPISVSQTLVVSPFGEDTGTSENPWQIRTLTQLNAIRGEYLDDHFLLTTDLDFSGYTYEDPEKGWLPIGHDSDASSDGYQGTRFTGSFDGNGYVIRNLRVDRGGEDYVGLFGGVGSGGSIVSLGLENLEVTGGQRVGGLVGYSEGTVMGSYATGSVMGASNVGGLVGYSEGTVMGSYATGSVMGASNVGGLVGYSEGTVMGSYATGSVTGASNVGGLVGENDQGTVTGSYATGSVTGDQRVGGLVGWNPDSSTVKRSYWNTELSGNADSSGGVGLTTTDMFVKANFVGFDFTGTRALGGNPEVASVWLPPISGQHFPHLRGVSKNGQILSVPGAEVIAGSAPFLLVHTLLPPTVSEQAPAFSGDDDTVATIDASTGMITLAVGVTGGKAMTITVRRGGDSTYSSVTGLQVLQVKVVPLMLMPATIANQTYAVSTVIPDLNLPEATSGMGPYTYTLDPVPAGLEFDADTRTLSGTPSAPQVATQHTYTVTDSTTDTALTATLTFTITVNVAGTPTFMGTIENQTYTKDTAIDALALPEATGGMGPYTYTLDPVPAGLSFDAASRTLSGTPTEATAIATHTYTVTDSASSALTAALTFTITVNDVREALTFMTTTVKAQTYTKNTAIQALNLPEATGGMGPYTYTLDPVPAGLSFDAASRTLSGIPDATQALTRHTYTVTDNTTDTALTASLTFTITVSEAETTFGIGSQGVAVHVYPNPAGDVLHIEFPGADEYGIALLTVTGQLVPGEWHAGGGSRILNLSSLTKGVYVLKIEDNEGVSHTFRIIR